MYYFKIKILFSKESAFMSLLFLKREYGIFEKKQRKLPQFSNQNQKETIATVLSPLKSLRKDNLFVGEKRSHYFPRI